MKEGDLLWGMAGARGILRCTFHEGGRFQGYALAAIIGGSLVARGFLAFLVNLVGTLGLRNLFSPVLRERWLAGQQEPAPVQV